MSIKVMNVKEVYKQNKEYEQKIDNLMKEIKMLNSDNYYYKGIPVVDEINHLEDKIKRLEEKEEKYKHQIKLLERKIKDIKDNRDFVNKRIESTNKIIDDIYRQREDSYKQTIKELEESNAELIEVNTRLSTELMEQKMVNKNNTPYWRTEITCNSNNDNLSIRQGSSSGWFDKWIKNK